MDDLTHFTLKVGAGNPLMTPFPISQLDSTIKTIGWAKEDTVLLYIGNMSISQLNLKCIRSSYILCPSNGHTNFRENYFPKKIEEKEKKKDLHMTRCMIIMACIC